MNIQLGLDLSTTVCGYAFVDIDTKIILECGFIDISKTEEYKEKIKLITDKLDSSCYIKLINKINLEAALSGFGGGRTSQQILIKLSRFNAVVEYVLSDYYKMKIFLTGAMTARKQLFGKSRLKGVKSKQFVKDNIEKMFDLKKWQIVNKIGNVDKRVEDTYDAIVIGFYK